MEQARELVGVLQGLEEWGGGPGTLRPIPHLALNDSQVGLIYSLVLLALMQKTESTADGRANRGAATCGTRWLACTTEELEEVRARLASFVMRSAL